MARGYESHESFWADVLMYLHMVRRAVLLGLIVQLLFIGYYFHGLAKEVSTLHTSEGQGLPISITWKYFTGVSILGADLAVEPELVPYAKGWPALEWRYYRAVADYATGGMYNAIETKATAFIWRSLACYAVSLLYIVGFYLWSQQRQDEKFLRGAKTTPLKTLNKKLRTAGSGEGLCVGDTIIPRSMETKHMLILGSAGSGKSVLLTQLLVQLIMRNERLIVYDPKGELVSKLYRQGDMIFNPFDLRSVGWNVFNEIFSEPDYDVIARSLFGPPDSRDAYWYNCGADVFRTGLVWLRMHGKTCNNDIWEFFSQPLAGIQQAFRMLPVTEQGALKHLDQSDSPASATIISILQERIQVFRYLRGLDGGFSFSRFVRDEKAKGNIFLLGNERTRTLMRPLLTLAIDIMSREALSLPDDLNRRLFFVIDELGTLNRMDSILTLETVGRSKGCSVICANQDLGRIEEIYGKSNLKTFFNNFSTLFAFRVREPETADFLSRAIGERQIRKRHGSVQMSPSDVGDRKGFTDQERTERLIMPSELQSLPDLQAILNVAGFGVSQITIPEMFYRTINPPLVPREFPDFNHVQHAKPMETLASKLKI